MRWLVKYNSKSDPDRYKELVIEAATQASCCIKFTKENPGCYIKGFPRPIGGQDPNFTKAPK